LNDSNHKNYKKHGASIETELYDDFVVLKEPPQKTKIIDEDHLRDILKDNDEAADEPVLYTTNVSAANSKSVLMESTQRSAMKPLKGKDPLQASGKKLQVVTEVGDGVDGKSPMSRLADSALKNFKLTHP